MVSVVSTCYSPNPTTKNHTALSVSNSISIHKTKDTGRSISHLHLIKVGRLESVTPSRISAMTKVYPNVAPTSTNVKSSTALNADHAAVLTVWKKSLLFNCNGFTVYDCNGDLVFRVDNYMAPSGSNGEILLMDAAGKPLLTIRRKRLSLGDSWLVFDGETGINPRYSAKKHVNLLNSKCLAHLTAAGCSKRVMYEIEGSYSQRCCAVYDEKKRRVVEIKQKEAVVGGAAFGVDVFRLIVGPEIDTSVAMAIVILLEQMFGSSRRFISA